MNQILINQQENQLININNKEVQNITLNQNENQLIGINNSETQNIDINQKDNQLIYISNEGSAIGISNVLVNGVSVVSGNVAYVVVPTKTSELENDSGYLTRETDPTVPRYIKTITLNDINNWNNKQDTLVSGTNIKTINNTSLLGSGNIEIEGSSYTAGTGIEITNDNVINNRITSYNSLTDLPTIPTKTSELLNDNNFVESSNLASVAFSGSYLDLIDDPVIPQNTSDLYNDSGFITNTVNDLTNYTTTTNLNSMLNNKQDTLVSGTNIKTINNTSLLGSGNINISGGGGTPTDVQINGTSITSNNVANILTESAYDSTTNKIATVSDLPTVNDGTLTIQKNGTTIDTFTANSSSNKTINVTVPTTTSELTNNSNFAVTNANNNFSASQSINGTITATDHLDTQYIELSSGVPYIDFHYNYSNADFTSRIIESDSGKLTTVSDLIVGGANGEGGNLKIMKALRGFNTTETIPYGMQNYTITLTAQQFNFTSTLGAVLIVVGSWSTSTDTQVSLYLLSWSGYLMAYSALNTIIQGQGTCTLTRNQDDTLTLNITGNGYNLISLF